MFIINSIAPIFLLIAFGKLLQKSGFLPEAFFKGLNQLVFRFALPALLICSISTAELKAVTIGRLVAVLTVATLMTLATAWILARILRLPPEKKGSFIQGSFRGNGAFIGLPVILYSIGSLDPQVEPLATVILAPLVVLFNILGVSVLLHYGRKRRDTAKSMSTFFIQLVRNPLIIACLIGFVLNLSGWKLPLFLFRSMDALGRAALPMILISIGSSLTIDPLRGAASPSLIASLLKVAVAPVFGFLLAGLLDLDATERMITVLYLAAPTAGMSFVMAEVMDNDATLAGRIVALSTLLSAITLPIIIAIGY